MTSRGSFSAGSPGAPAPAAAVRARFRRRYGSPPDGVWSAPGRVNLVGEHTDYNGGWVLPFAIGLRTYAAGAVRTDDTVRVHSATTAKSAEFAVGTRPGEVADWAAYVAGVLWSFRQRGYDVPGVNLVVGGDVPLGAGLSSSAALECAVATALADLAELDLGRSTIARLAQDAENGYVGVPSGGMDQLAAMHGRAGHVLLIDMRGPDIEPVAADFTAGPRLLVIDTTVRHRLAAGGYASRRAECERAAAALGVAALRDADDSAVARLVDPVLRRRAWHVVAENRRVLDAGRLLRGASGAALGGDDAAALGAVLTASHRSLRDDFEVSVLELDLAVDTALAHGALGARMTGAGFGGCVLALLPAPLVEGVSTACTDAFVGRGFRAPHIFEVLPAQGARLDSAGR